MKLLYSFIFITFFILSSNAQAKDNIISKNNTLLTISATAKYKAVPDIAIVSAGIRTESFSANDALKENSIKMSNVFKALEKANVNKKDIQTSGLNIIPQYNYIPNLPPRVKSYVVSNTVRITIRNIEDIGSTLDALVSQGVNTMQGPLFSIEKPDNALDIARKKAIKKAQHKAKLYAEALGLKIKRIISISEYSQNNQPVAFYSGLAMLKSSSMMSNPSPTTPISSGQIELSSTVSIEYGLAP